MSTPTLLAHPDSPIGRRAGFAQHNLWVTPYAPEERRAAGEYPNQHAGGDGLPRWTAQDRPIAGTDVVVWYSFGVTHFVRPEDWPVMPVEYTGFTLMPFGFFDRNPALDVPASDAHCRRTTAARVMGTWTREELQQAHDHYVEVAQEAGRSGDWRAWADLFTEDVDLRRAPLRHVRRAARRSTRGSPRRWREWPNSEMKEFPHDWCVCDEERGWWICQIENRFVDPGDGEVYQAYNLTVLKYAGDGLFSCEEDAYNPANFAPVVKAVDRGEAQGRRRRLTRIWTAPGCTRRLVQ